MTDSGVMFVSSPYSSGMTQARLAATSAGSSLARWMMNRAPLRRSGRQLDAIAAVASRVSLWLNVVSAPAATNMGFS
jgi:hypothetical protein